MSCDECGSTNLSTDWVDGKAVAECGLCGHLQGDDATVARVLAQRRAQELGISVELHGLIEVLDSIVGLRVDRDLCCAVPESAPPAVFFAINQQPLAILDRLCRSLLLAGPSTSHVWTVEVSYQHGLLFVLRPRLFHSAGEMPDQELVRLRADVDVLWKALRRDTRLDWWDFETRS